MEKKLSQQVEFQNAILDAMTDIMKDYHRRITNLENQFITLSKLVNLNNQQKDVQQKADG